MCRLMHTNQVRVPPVATADLSVSYPFVGKNCNPNYLDVLHAWFGTAGQQVQWADRFSYQFYENKLFLPEVRNIPFDRFVLGTQLRHPSTRLYSLFREKLSFLSNMPLIV